MRGLPRPVVPLVLLLAAAAWLWCRAEPPSIGRALFGLWRVRDAVVVLTCAWLAVFAFARRRGRMRLVLATFAAGFAWLLAEAAAFVLLPASPPPVLGSVRLPNAAIDVETVPDTTFAFGLPAETVRFRFETNVHGHRNPPDRTRGDVWCVGDSYLVAPLLEWQDGVVAQLERRLGRPCINVALIGLAPQEAQQEFEHASRGADLTGCTVLQFLCEDNDLLDSARVAAAVPPAPPPWRQRALVSLLIDALQRWTQPVRNEAARRTGDYRGTPVRFLWRHERGSDVEQQVPVIERALDDFRARVEARGARFAVVLIPQKLRVLGPACTFPPESDLVPLDRCASPLPEALARWSERTRVPFLDLGPPLRFAAEAGTLVWFPDDTHWNAAGAALAAEHTKILVY
jgi:hypothetical protein